MSSQVRKPRFYVDLISYFHALGISARQFLEYDGSLGLSNDNWNGGFFGNEAPSDGQTEYLYMDPVYPVRIEVPDYTSVPKLIAQLGGNKTISGRDDLFPIFPINFVGFFNHNFADISRTEPSDLYQQGVGAQIRFQAKASMHDANFSSNHFSSIDATNITNAENITTTNEDILFSPQWNGFSLISLKDSNGKPIFPDSPNSWEEFKLYADFDNEHQSYGFQGNTNGMQLGSFVIGKYWEPPFSPDLNVRMTKAYPNVKKERTLGGRIVSNLNYNSPAEWYRTNRYGQSYRTSPFELEATTDITTTSTGQETLTKDYKQMYFGSKEGLGRKGIRSWEFEYSYINDEDTFIAYESTSMAPYVINNPNTNENTNTTPPLDEKDNSDSAINRSDASSSNPILNDESFHWIWQHTLGGHIPFLFQPDNTNNNPDQFAVCTFRQNSMSVEQVSSSVYKLKVTIDEVG